MISWIQRNMQRHHKILFGGLLFVVIIAFVFVTNASTGLGRAERTVLKREFFGHNLGSDEAQTRIFGDANLSATLQLGYSGFGPEQLQAYAFQRIAAMHLADELGLPVTTKEAIAEHIRTLRSFASEDGSFDPVSYATFRDSLKVNDRITEADVARVLGDDVRINRVQQLVGGPGYVLDADVRTALTRTETTWTFGIATASYTDFKPTIANDSGDLAKFFGENTFRYEIGPRAVVRALNFPAADYLNSVQVTDEEVRAVFDRYPGAFAKPTTEGATPEAAGPNDYLFVRDQIEAELKLQRARNLATKAASDLALALYENPGTKQDGGVEAYIASRQLRLQPLAPFTREAGPAEFGQSPEIAAAAFRLNEFRRLSDAVTHHQGAVILYWQEIQPSRTPLLSEVLEKVSADYTESEKRKRFVELGRALKAAIQDKLQAGNDFAEAVAAAGRAHSITLEAKQLAPFTRREPVSDAPAAILSTLDRIEAGQVSDMVITTDQGLLVYATNKKLPDLSEANPQYGEARAQLAMLTSRLGASAVINELVAAELKKSEPVLN
jgi:peptidyl-prolyl cis-trans isomerase D